MAVAPGRLLPCRWPAAVLWGRWLGLASLCWLAGCAAVPLDLPRMPSYAIEKPLETPLGREFSAQLATAPGQSGVHLLVSGQEAFAARVALADAAHRSLDLQYYVVTKDATTSLLLHRALLAARRGVRVRLLIDDMNAAYPDADLAILAMHPEVEVRLFNPFSVRGISSTSRLLELLGGSERLNRRMHNKLWIADNAVAVMGGRNLGEAYFDPASSGGFADLDALVAGPVVPDISASFDRYWNSEWAVPVQAFVRLPASEEDRDAALADMAAQAEAFRRKSYAQTVRDTTLGPAVRAGTLPLVAAKATLLYDTPGEVGAGVPDKKGGIFPVLRQIIERAQREVILVSPYLVPSDRSIELFCGLRQRGVRVRVLTNSLASSDVPLVHAGYSRYRPRLLACGVELHELRPKADRSPRAKPGLSSGASLHTKAVIVDGQSVFLGSMNLDPRSKRLNTEVALQLDSVPLGRQIVQLFDEATSPDQVFRVELEEPGNPGAALHWTSREGEQTVRYVSEPMASAWRRLSVLVLGALTPEDML